MIAFVFLMLAPQPTAPPPNVDKGTSSALPLVVQFSANVANAAQNADLAEKHARWAEGRAAMEPQYRRYADRAVLVARAWRCLANIADNDSNLVRGETGGWEWLSDATAVKVLKALLGDDDYAAGRMPPPCPSWAKDGS